MIKHWSKLLKCLWSISVSRSDLSTVLNCSLTYQEMMLQNVSPPLIKLLLLLLPQLFFGFLEPNTNWDTPRLTLLNVGIYFPTIHDHVNDQEVTKDDCNGQRLILIIYCHHVVRHSLPPNTKRQFYKSYELPLPLSLRRTNLWLKKSTSKRTADLAQSHKAHWINKPY